MRGSKSGGSLMGEEKLPWLCPGWSIDSFFKRNCSATRSKPVLTGLRGRALPWSGALGYGEAGIYGETRALSWKTCLRPNCWPTFWGGPVHLQSGIRFWGKHCQVIGVANSNVRVKNWNYAWGRSLRLYKQNKLVVVVCSLNDFFFFLMQWNVINAAFISCLLFEIWNAQREELRLLLLQCAISLPFTKNAFQEHYFVTYIMVRYVTFILLCNACFPCSYALMLCCLNGSCA